MVNDPPITAEEAYRRARVEGEMQKDIAEDVGCSESWISQLVNGYEDGQQSGIQQVQENPEDHLDLDELIGDRETRDPRAKCPACGSMIPRPSSAGEQACPSCGAALEWSESEVA